MLTLGLNGNEFGFLQTIDLFRQAQDFELRDSAGQLDEAATQALLTGSGLPDAPAPEGLTWSSSGIGFSRDLRPGIYELTWDGEAELTLSGLVGLSVVDSAPGRLILEVDERPAGSIAPQGFSRLEVEITGDSAPSQIEFYYQDDKALLNQGLLWQPSFVDKVAEAGLFRTMKLQNTVNSNVVEWDLSQELIDTANWSERVPLEALVELANAAGSDLWFNIPHGASEEYVAEAARFLNDRLDPGVALYVEYSNEHWIGGANFDFWAAESAALFYDGPPPADRDVALDVAEYYATRAATLSEIFVNAVEADGPREMGAVLTAQVSRGPSQDTTYLEALWQAPRAAALGLATPATSDVFDAISTDAYFDGGLSARDGNGFRVNYEGLRAVWREEGAEAAADAYFDFITRESDLGYRFPDAARSFARDGTTQSEAAARWADWGDFAASNGLRYVAYEGGPSVTWAQLQPGNAEESAFGLFLDSLNEDPRMVEIGLRITEDFAAAGGDTLLYFADFGDNGPFGNWSSFASVFEEQTTLRGASYRIANALEPGGTALRGDSGADRLFGDGEDDVILGQDGNDLLRGRGGNDILLGGAGNDNIVSGSGDDILLGGDGYDYLDAGAGRDVVDGGALKDIISVGGNSGETRIFGGESDASADELVFNSNGSGVGVSIAFATAESGDFLFSDTGAEGSFQGIEVIKGTARGDVFDAASVDSGVRVDGRGGNDSFLSGAGDDVFTGGWGSDVFVFSGGTGRDRVTDFDLTRDQVDLSALGWSETQLASALMQDDGGNAVLDLGEGDATVLFDGVSAADLAQELDIWIL